MPVRDTSLAVYQNKVIPNMSTRQRQVYEIFRQFPYSNFTNAEVAQEMGWSINRITPRTGELRDLGLIEEVSRRVCNVTGNLAWAKRLKK